MVAVGERRSCVTDLRSDATNGDTSDLFATITFKDVRGTITDITVSGDLGVETGTYSWTIVPAGGSPLRDTGKYLHVWSKSPEGAWKVIRYMSNSGMP